MLELLVKPLKEKRFDLALQYKNLLTQSDGIKLIEISNSIAVEAAAIRANHQLKTPDAIQLATANFFSVNYFLTNDKHLKTGSEMNIITLDELQTS